MGSQVTNGLEIPEAWKKRESNRQTPLFRRLQSLIRAPDFLSMRRTFHRFPWRILVLALRGTTEKYLNPKKMFPSYLHIYYNIRHHIWQMFFRPWNERCNINAWTRRLGEAMSFRWWQGHGASITGHHSGLDRRKQKWEVCVLCFFWKASSGEILFLEG